MLVLARIVGDSLTIGDDILIRVVDISENTVKFGIVAPSNLEIIRDDAGRNENGTRQRKNEVFGRACQNLQERAKEVF